MNDYIQAQLAKLLPEQEALQKERADIQSQLQEQNTIISTLADQLEKQCTDEISAAIFNKFKKLEYSADRLREFFYRLEEDYEDQYERAKDSYATFRKNPLFQSLDEIYVKKKSLIEKRQANTHKLSHKSNYMNINKQIEDLQNGTEARDIEKNARQHVESVFMQKDDI